jgi:hypothetical protein
MLVFKWLSKTQHATGLKLVTENLLGTPTCRRDVGEGAREVGTEKRITKKKKRGHYLKMLRFF